MVGRRQGQDLHRLDRRSGFRSLAASTAEARQTVLSLAAGSLGNAEVGRQQGSAELVAQGSVAARQTPSDRVAQAQGIPRDMECVEAVMVKGARWALHVDFSAQDDALLRRQIQIISITYKVGIDRSI